MYELSTLADGRIAQLKIIQIRTCMLMKTMHMHSDTHLKYVYKSCVNNLRGPCRKSGKLGGAVRDVCTICVEPFAFVHNYCVIT